MTPSGTAAKPAKTWVLTGKVRGKNENNRNEGGLILMIQTLDNGVATGISEEVGGIAFERSNSLNPDKDFETAVEEKKEVVAKTIEVLQELEAKKAELLAGAGTLA